MASTYTRSCTDERRTTSPQGTEVLDLHGDRQEGLQKCCQSPAVNHPFLSATRLGPDQRKEHIRMSVVRPVAQHVDDG